MVWFDGSKSFLAPLKSCWTEMKWVLRELAMDDGLFESKVAQFSGDVKKHYRA